jgi:competence protein ComEA
MRLSRRETVVLLILIICLAVINTINYIRREQQKAQHMVYIEELAVQISVNEASADELEMLPGIGPSLASRIIEYRQTHGGFKTLDELKNVRGIGEKLFAKIQPYLRL